MKAQRTLGMVAGAVLLCLIVPSLAAAAPVGGTGAVAATGHPVPLSAVFTMTNNATANSVVAYRIGTGGALIPAGSYATHGRGLGSSLADQGSLALTADHAWLLVVDAGSSQVSAFRVSSATSGALLSFTDRVASGGVLPVSIAVHGSLVYVLNVGNSTVAGGIAGFYLTSAGLLLPLPGSHRPLATPIGSGAAQIAFDPAGRILVVTEKASSLLDAYSVGPLGYASGPVATASNGSTPYGFAFSPNGHLLVSDAGPGALSSYALGANGTASVLSATVLDNQSAPCWVVVGEGGRYAYTTNAHSNSISTYQVERNGTLLLVASVGATTGTAPTDLATTTGNGLHLLVYDSGAGEIDEFDFGAGGVLSKIASVYGLASTSEGLVAF